MNKMYALLLMLPGTLLANVCDTSSAPFCPNSGVRMLDDTFPVQSFVISAGSGSASTTPRGLLPARSIAEVFRAYNFNTESTPFVIFPATREDYDATMTNLRAQLQRDGVSADRIDALIRDRIRPANGESYTWQQDYFEAAFNPATGAPQVRFSPAYNLRPRQPSMSPSVEAIGRSGACDVSRGDDFVSVYARLTGQSALPQEGEEETRRSGDRRASKRGSRTPPSPDQNRDPRLTDAGEYGGNLEGLPGGLCLVGNTASQEFANQICGSEANTVRVDSSFLAVGHVDEIFKVVADRRTVAGRPPECAFSILSSDTALGLSLLDNNPDQNVITLDLESPTTDDQFAGLRSINENLVGSIMCPLVPESTPAPGPRGAPAVPARRSFLSYILPYAYAQETRPQDNRPARTTPSGKPRPTAEDRARGEREASRYEAQHAAEMASAQNCSRGVNQVTNRATAGAIRGNIALMEYNQLIQQSLMRSRQQMFDAIIARLPQCRPFFPNVASMFTPVPNVFGVTPLEELENNMDTINGQRVLVASGNADSMFPNPTNSVLMNSSLLLPGPQPRNYQTYLYEKLGGLGLTGRTVDTWDYAHINSGNLHCSTHTLPACRPRTP